MNIFEELLLCKVPGNRREKRRLQHLARCADKKESRRTRAKRGKNVRPFVRFTTSGFIIRIGNDFEIYESEVVQRAEERIRQREDEWDDFLFEVAFNNAYTDYDDEPWNEDDLDDNF